MPRKNRQIKHVRAEYILATCESKRKYRSQNEAEKIAEIQMLANQGLELGVYKCDLCSGWHLTSAIKTHN